CPPTPRPAQHVPPRSAEPPTNLAAVSAATTAGCDTPRGARGCEVPPPTARSPCTCGSTAAPAPRLPRPAEAVRSPVLPAAALPLPPRPTVALSRSTHPVVAPVATDPLPTIRTPAPPLPPRPAAPPPRPPLPPRPVQSPRPTRPQFSPRFSVRTRLRAGSRSDPELPVSDHSPTLQPADESEALASAAAAAVPRDPAAPRPRPRHCDGLRTSRRSHPPARAPCWPPCPPRAGALRGGVSASPVGAARRRRAAAAAVAEAAPLSPPDAPPTTATWLYVPPCALATIEPAGVPGVNASPSAPPP
ncbi:hypothetical protein BU14_0120s0003, partial [Porphyra umbilicalis]